MSNVVSVEATLEAFKIEEAPKEGHLKGGDLKMGSRRVAVNRAQKSISATPQQSEICVKFSVFHTVLASNLVKCSDSETQTLENVARGKFHQNFTRNFTTPLAEKNGENVHCALLQ